MARVEVITGLERRRRWSEEQKRAIVAESLAPGAIISEVARRADVCPGQIYRWRQEFRTVVDGFAQVLIAPPDPAPEAGDGAIGGEPAIEVAFAGKVRIRIKGFPEAITRRLPVGEVQTCIVHLLRHSLDFVSCKGL
jgi:transposase